MCVCVAPEIHLLHLDVAVYYYFVQLYTMYPCNFMDYLKARYGPKGEVYIFKRHIAVSTLLVDSSSSSGSSSSSSIDTCVMWGYNLTVAITEACQNASRVGIPIY